MSDEAPPTGDRVAAEGDAVLIEIAGLTAEDLDGHTLDELQDYLDRGRFPIDPSIESSAPCQIALDALARLRRATLDLFRAEAAALPPADESWIAGIMNNIGREARSGRRVPLVVEDEQSDLAVTEGALRGAVRAAGDADPDVLVGSCRFTGDLELPGAPVHVQVTLAVRWGRPARHAADSARDRIRRALQVHSELDIRSIDIDVDELWGIPNGGTNDE